MNTTWHDGKIVGVAGKKPHNDWSDSEICEIWPQKHGPIQVILWFVFLKSRHLKIISENVVPHELFCFFFTVVNNHLESQFIVVCVDKLLSTVNSVLIDNAMSANDVTMTNF